MDHPALFELADDQHAAVAALAIPQLLRSFPPRATSKQLPALRYMLRAAIRHCPAKELVQVIDRKLAIRSMNVAQRICWCCTGLLVEPAAFTSRLRKEIAGGGERRVRHVASYLTSDDNEVWIGKLNVPELESPDPIFGAFIQALKPHDRSWRIHRHREDGGGRAGGTSDRERLSAIASTEASEALEGPRCNRFAVLRSLEGETSERHGQAARGSPGGKFPPCNRGGVAPDVRQRTASQRR